MRAKFHELAGTVLTPEGVSRSKRRSIAVKQWKSVRELVALMREHAKL